MLQEMNWSKCQQIFPSFPNLFGKSQISQKICTVDTAFALCKAKLGFISSMLSSPELCSTKSDCYVKNEE